MKRLIALTVFLAASLSLFAQTTPLVATVQPSFIIVNPGELAYFQTSIINPPATPASNVRVVFSFDGDATIEAIEGHAQWSCTINGRTAECTQPPGFAASNGFLLTVRAGATNGGTSILTMSGTAAQPVTAPAIATATLQAFQTIAVETTADAGPGSLRAAIETANTLGKPVKIEFRLPPPVPAEGWFTIIPESPLPPITADRVSVDGKSQTRFTGDTNTRGPEIAIDGRRAHRGLEIHSPCLARVEGLVLGNFDANQGLWFTRSRECANRVSFETDRRVVAGNYIGTDPTGTIAWPNRRGLRGDFGDGIIENNLISGNTYSGIWIWVGTSGSYLIEKNRFGTAADGVTPLPNGAAGILFGDRVTADVRENVIANHPGMGIALVRGGNTYIQIRRNSMRDNGGIGIDWGIDGVTPRRENDLESDPNAPVLLSAFYDAATKRTYFNVSSKSVRPYADGFSLALDFYANRTADGDGEEWIGSTGVNASDGSAYLTWIDGDHRGKWINATLTRAPVFFSRPPTTEGLSTLIFDDSTSELSNAVFVAP
jgi:hypothetical protein